MSRLEETQRSNALHLHVVCEILDPHTPKMVNVQPLRNPFLPCKDVHVDVTFFCTNMLETAMFALSCYNPLLTDFHKRTVRSIAGLKEIHGSSSKSGTLPKFKIIQVKSLFGDSDDDGVDEWPQVRGVRAYYSSVLFECKAREFFFIASLSDTDRTRSKCTLE